MEHNFHLVDFPRSSSHTTLALRSAERMKMLEVVELSSPIYRYCMGLSRAIHPVLMQPYLAQPTVLGLERRRGTVIASTNVF